MPAIGQSALWVLKSQVGGLRISGRRGRVAGQSLKSFPQPKQQSWTRMVEIFKYNLYVSQIRRAPKPYALMAHVQHTYSV